FYCSATPRDLHSFPTRRSSDLAEDVKKRIHDLVEIPRLVEKTLELDGQIAGIARELAGARDFLYLGRGLQYPIALEGALKLKERSEEHTSELQSRSDLVCRLLL